jgi:PAS domain S-box-containing protein
MSADPDPAMRIAELEAELARLRAAAALPYRAIVEDMSEMVVRWKPDGTRLFVNDAYCRFFGATREELIGTTFWPLITEEDRQEVRARIAALGPEHPVSSGRHRAVLPGGGLAWMEWVDRAIFEDGSIVELQSVGRDISERVRFEEQARRVARGDAAARATAAVSHDLRNVLQIISNAARLLEQDPRDPRGGAGIQKSIQLGYRLLAQLGELSHSVPVEPKAIDLGARVRGLRDLLVEMVGRGVHLEDQLRPACSIVADPTQIDQVLLNLVRNAADAMPQGGTVVIATEVVPATSLPADRRPRGTESVVLRVSDSGTGISAELLPRVFDARITTKHGGQGLGLATVKTIVEGNEGTIHVSSSPRGTAFEIAFPRAR